MGAMIGSIGGVYQDKLYIGRATRNGAAVPELRLFAAAFGGMLFAASTFGFAWTGRPGVPWPVPITLLVLTNAGIYLVYLGFL